MKITKETKIGLFVVVVLIATFFTVNFLKGNDIFNRTRNYYSYYRNVEGLTPSTAVLINGYKAGTIAGIDYVKKTHGYVIRMTVNGDYEIPADSHSEIFSADLLGGKAIRIIYGTSTDLCADGDTIPGNLVPDMFAGLMPLKDQLSGFIANLNRTVDNVNQILNDETKTDISNILQHISDATSNLGYITGKIKGETPEIKGIIENLNTLTTRLNTSAVSLDKTMGNVEKITAQVKEADIKEAVENLKDLIEKIQSPEGSIGRMMTTDSLHNSINSLVTDLDSLIKKIEAEPKKYLKISVF